MTDVKVNGELVKFDERDTHALIDQKYIRGGTHFVENMEHLNMIPENIQKRGMHVLVGDNMRTYINQGAKNSWLLKPEMMKFNGSSPDASGNMKVDTFDRLIANYLITGEDGIEYYAQTGEIENMITGGYVGDGLLVGNHNNNSALIVKNNARIISLKGSEYQVSTADISRGGIGGVKNKAGHYEIEWQFAFQRSCVLTGVKFEVSGTSHKCLIRVYDSDGKLLGSSGSIDEYKNSFVNQLTQGSNSVNISNPAYIIGNAPITFKIITDTEIEIGHGMSREYGFDTATASYIVQDINHGAIQHSGSDIGGNLNTTPTLLTDNGLKIFELSKENKTIELYENTKIGDGQKEYYSTLPSDMIDQKNPITVKSLTVFSGRSDSYGIQVKAELVKNNDGTLITTRYSIIESEKEVDSEGENKAVLTFEKPIYIAPDEHLKLKFYRINKTEFSLLINDYDMPYMKVNYSHTHSNILNKESLNKVVDVKPTRDGDRRFLQLQFEDGTYSGTADVSVWFD